MKTKLFALIFLIFLSMAFAEDFYRVTDVRGKATYDNSGNWELIYSGQKVSSGTMIRVGINSSVTITDKDGITHVIKQLSKGSIKALIAPETSFSRAEKITVEDVAGTTTTKKGVSTAAVRGDPADEDEWEE